MKSTLLFGLALVAVVFPMSGRTHTTEISPQVVKTKPANKAKAKSVAPNERWLEIAPQTTVAPVESMLRFHVPVTGPLLDLPEQRGMPRFNLGEPLAGLGWRKVNGGHFLNADVTD